jgi:hypothetical protein
MPDACDCSTPNPSFDEYQIQEQPYHRRDRLLYPSIRDDKRAIHFVDWINTKFPSDESREYVLKYISMDPYDHLFVQEVERINKLILDDRIKLNRLYSDISPYIRIRLPYYYATPLKNPRTKGGDDPMTKQELSAILLSLGIRGCRGADGNIVFSNTGGNAGTAIIPDTLKECPPRKD